MANANAQAVAALQAEAERFAVSGVGRYAITLTEGLTTGRGRSPGVPVDEGEALGSLRLTVGRKSSASSRRPYRILTAGRVKSVLRSSWRLGRSLWWTYVAPHVRIIAPGRRRGPSGKMVGSEQAPNGWVYQSIDEANADIRHHRRVPRAA